MGNRHLAQAWTWNCARVLAFALMLTSLIDSRYAIAALTPLEIIQPRAGATLINRFYRAYPGLPYNVQIAAIGGRYPYTYTLLSGPSGMRVDTVSGELSWTASAAPTNVQVSVSVKDAIGAVATVPWSIKVTTVGFRFLDAINGTTQAQGADGSLSRPWRSIGDWYATKGDAAHRNDFLYFRSGVYRTGDAPIEDAVRLALVSSKPLVWLAYPGDSPVIDTSTSYVAAYGGVNNLYIEGFEFRNFEKRWGLRIDSDADDVTVRRNVFRNLPLGAGGIGTNAAGVFISDAGVLGKNWVIAENVFREVHDAGYGLLGYSTTKTLVTGNTCLDFTMDESKCIGPKLNTQLWFIRDNRINIAHGDGIWVWGGAVTHSVEISYNLVQVQSGHTLWVGQGDMDYGAVEIFRNTLIGAPISVDNLTNVRGPVSFVDDVVVSGDSFVSLLTPHDRSSSARIQTLGELKGGLADGLVDANGRLIGVSAHFIGKKGYQRGVSNNSAKPKAPSGVAAP